MDLSNISELKKFLHENNFWTKKRFGQNLLVNKKILEKIIESAEIKNTDNILEIGPGLGVLTRELCEKAGHVTSIETDKTVMPLLKETTKNCKNLIIINDDALKIDIKTIFADQKTAKPYKLVANLPYNIATRLLQNFLRSDHPPELMVVLTQLEVAQKTCAIPPDMNVLALTIQPFGKPVIITKIAPQNFFPAPKVTSAILKIQPYKKSLIEKNTQQKYFEIIHAVFQQKRKQLAATLAKKYKKPKSEIENLLEKINLPPNIRPQQVSLEKWIELSQIAV